MMEINALARLMILFMSVSAPSFAVRRKAVWPGFDWTATFVPVRRITNAFKALQVERPCNDGETKVNVKVFDSHGAAPQSQRVSSTCRCPPVRHPVRVGLDSGDRIVQCIDVGQMDLK